MQHCPPAGRFPALPPTGYNRGMNGRELASMLSGLAVGIGLALVMLVCTPLWAGVCFFLIGSEHGPVGPTLLALYFAAMALMPGIGGLVGWSIWRANPEGPPEST